MDRKTAQLLRDVRPFVTDDHLRELLDEELADFTAKQNSLTHRQAQVLEFIRRYIASEARSPSYIDIMRNFGWQSMNAAVEHVQKLEVKGFVTVTPRTMRGISLVQDRSAAVRSPCPSL